MKHMDKITVFIAELLGTGMLLFFGCAGCITYWSGGVANHLQIVLNFGFAVMFCIQIFAPLSGAHLNTAVTVAAIIFGKIDLAMGGIYFVAQALGSFMGFGLLKFVTPAQIFSPGGVTANSTGLCMTIPHEAVSASQAVILEFIGTSVVILICCACAWDPRNAHNHDSLPLRFGLAIAGIACAIVSISETLEKLLIRCIDRLLHLE